MESSQYGNQGSLNVQGCKQKSKWRENDYINPDLLVQCARENWKEKEKSSSEEFCKRGVRESDGVREGLATQTRIDELHCRKMTTFKCIEWSSREPVWQLFGGDQIESENEV